MIKHLIGFIGVSLILFGIGFLYTSATENPDAVWWDQGVIGALCIVGGIAICWRWSRIPAKTN